MENELRTSGLQALYIHETHRAGRSEAPGNSKLCGSAGIFGQMDQLFIVEINVNFTEMGHERYGRHQKPGEIKGSRNWSRFSQVHLERGPWIVGFIREVAAASEQLVNMSPVKHAGKLQSQRT